MKKKRLRGFKDISAVPNGFSGKAMIGGVPDVFSGKPMGSNSPEQAAEHKRKPVMTWLRRAR